MQKEEKTMSRVLNELRKCHPQIQSTAVRNGRVFQYKYFLAPSKQTKKNDRKRNIKEEEKMIKNQDEVQMTRTSSVQQLNELNDKSYERIKQSWGNGKKNIDKKDLLIEYFTELITSGKSAPAKR